MSKKIILTKHARQRMSLRKIQFADVERVMAKPDSSFPGGEPNSVKFIRQLQGREIHVVGTLLPDQRQWLVVSVWVRGENDPVPLVWQLLVAPFKLLWWLIKRLATYLVRR